MACGSISPKPAGTRSSGSSAANCWAIAFGRGVQLSDEPLLDEMRRKLTEHDYKFSVAVELIVRSQQFRKIRGREFVALEE